MYSETFEDFKMMLKHVDSVVKFNNIDDWVSFVATEFSITKDYYCSVDSNIPLHDGGMCRVTIMTEGSQYPITFEGFQIYSLKMRDIVHYMVLGQRDITIIGVHASELAKYVSQHLVLIPCGYNVKSIESCIENAVVTNNWEH